MIDFILLFCCTGSVTKAGLSDGTGTDTLFGSIRSLAQYQYGQAIVVADYANDCLRKIIRTTGKVSTFDRLCPAMDKDPERYYKMYKKPVCVLYQEKRALFYILAVVDHVYNVLTYQLTGK